MTILKINLTKPIKNGQHRFLTAAECADIRKQYASVRPYPGKNWTLHRNDDGVLSLRWDTKLDGASWAIEEPYLNTKMDRDHFPLESATASAERAADMLQLPQTVFSNNDTAGWWHTSPFATSLLRSKLHVTVLPMNYFS